jgi:EAL domain-containing protein (putative c-di-GMP-specific phosphodiesterase class I)
LGYLAPAKFIPIFEKNGSIVEVDRHIWEESCKILHRWKDIYPDLFLSINISPKDFYFTDVVSDIEHFVKKYDIDTRKLRIEITETALMTNAEDRFKIFDMLRSSGFIVEMDDFGSGYSSLNMLKDMPVDVLKIDMNFLAGENDAKSAIIMKNVIGLSNELDIIALTEGVETYEQFENLIKMGCSLFQGYYFAKPMDLPEFEKFVKNRNLFNG